MHTNISLQQLRYIIEVAECGSINAASQQLYVSQPTLSTTIKDTEQELGISIFNRTNRGITLTNEGTEFIGYARQILQQFDLFEARYSNSNSTAKGRLCVSSQHYAFCVHAFVDLAEECDEEEYNFSLRETRTAEVIDDVKEFRSEIGVLYLSEFNRKVLTKAFSDAGLTFTPLFEAHPHVFVGSNHPLAGRASLKPEDLEEYPRYSFEQGTVNSFYYAEEPLAWLPSARNIRCSDRGTLSNLLVSHNGYTLSTGVLSSEMQSGMASIPLKEDAHMLVGYIVHDERRPAPILTQYLSELRRIIADADRNGAVLIAEDGTSA